MMVVVADKETDSGIGLNLLVPVLAVATVALALLVVAALRPGVPDDAPTAAAEVVKVDGSSQTYSGGTNWIEVAYALPDGRRITARTTHFRTEDAVAGRQVQIRYDPDHTDRVAVVGASESWSSQWIYVIIAALAELALLVVIVRRWHANRTTPTAP